MEHNIEEKKPADDPQHRAQLAQVFRVRVDPILSEKNLQVAQEMSDDERDQDNAGDRDDEFFAN